jgi:hypothetical protein
VVVPSPEFDPSDPFKAVQEEATIERTLNGQTTSLTVNPSDRLIIGFGDSFTSGEGNPERPARFKMKNGEAMTWGNLPRSYGPKGVTTSALPAREADSLTSPDDSRAQWTDRWCHRSVYSWQIRSALDLALRDPQRSITILPYGCSGASIVKGIVAPYVEIEYSADRLRGQALIEGSGSELGLAYQEMCGRVSRPPKPASAASSSTRSQCGRFGLDTSSTPQQQGAQVIVTGRAMSGLFPPLTG